MKFHKILIEHTANMYINSFLLFQAYSHYPNETIYILKRKQMKRTKIVYHTQRLRQIFFSDYAYFILILAGPATIIMLV